MRTGEDGDRGTFTQAARRAQLVDCAIEALAQVGYQQTTVAEVARRAEVSKGVVTYYYPARDDLVWAVVAAVFASVSEQVGSRLEGVPPGQFVATYLGAWADYFRTHRREMMAIAEIWTSFRDADGRPHLDARTLGQERALVEAALTDGQAEGTLGDFSPRVMAVTLKAALDGLLAQLAIDPALDIDAYRDELVALFERATRRKLAGRAATAALPAWLQRAVGDRVVFLVRQLKRRRADVLLGVLG
jgi:AcrR family transcriptional regulator